MTMKEIECECGAKWLEKKIKVPMRDKDSNKCMCGRTLKSWNGGVMYRHTLISKPETQA